MFRSVDWRNAVARVVRVEGGKGERGWVGAELGRKGAQNERARARGGVDERAEGISVRRRGEWRQSLVSSSDTYLYSRTNPLLLRRRGGAWRAHLLSRHPHHTEDARKLPMALMLHMALPKCPAEAEALSWRVHVFPPGGSDATGALFP